MASPSRLVSHGGATQAGARELSPARDRPRQQNGRSHDPSSRPRAFLQFAASLIVVRYRSIRSAWGMNRHTRVRSVLFNLHLAGGLVAGVFLLISGVSGAVLAFSDEIDAFLQPSVFKVAPQAQRLPLTQLAASASAVLHPGDVIAVYVPSVRPDRSYWFTVFPRGHRLPRQ